MVLQKGATAIVYRIGSTSTIRYATISPRPHSRGISFPFSFFLVSGLDLDGTNLVYRLWGAVVRLSALRALGECRCGIRRARNMGVKGEVGHCCITSFGDERPVEGEL